MAGIVDFISSKIDPVSFFTSSSSAASSVFPYALDPFSTDFNSLQPEHDQDLASFAIRQYVVAVLSAPLRVAETLAEVQWQPQEEDEGDAVGVVGEAGRGLVAPGTPPKAILGDDEVLPPLQGGTWENLRDVVESDGEGFTSLLKGHFTSFCHATTYHILQPTLEDTINDVFDIYEDTHPVTLVASHLIVGGLLSPLELARTRLIVQASPSHRKKYWGPFHALHCVTTEEPAGLLSLYSPRHLIPSILISGMSPLIRALSKVFITEELGLDPSFSPFWHHMATLGAMAVEVAIVTPFEIARKRLQVQRLTKGNVDVLPQAFDTCVEVSPRYYSGIFDCMRSIVMEEGGTAHRRRRRLRRTRGRALPHSPSASTANDWHKIYDSDLPHGFYDGTGETGVRATGVVASVGRFATGVQSLYRGFWARYATRVVAYACDEMIKAEEEW
ncbi:mitochondrial carrier domain-containing protein [Fimicolochytrium jonesii]|uniref:mitochondrial carrier domain-containing protein n=1 Tax=Fimicolochytrium jonesii TaxID=1396493 RepID=UPI0022FDCB98|nr:mitochondrial carrier domain-containing protein [Fimicolochytrium jonesii]KAI8819921.1 mitochondrial carrier domain-containing protein [Fimicolochytrium jonesii]